MANSCDNCTSGCVSHNRLHLDKLSVDCSQGCCAKIDNIVANDVCSQTIEVATLSAQDGSINTLCSSGSIKASQVWADKAYSNSLCSTNANFQNACIQNLTIGNFNPCITYRATVNYGINTTYTLGSFLNFTNIVDDPNNNISLNPTTYTAPATGYYTLSYKVNVENLVSTNGPVLGIPVANPEVYVNGLLVREAFSPFLSFFNTQKVIVDSLITLQMGDQVTMKYNILAGNGSSVIGTVDIVGAGIEDGNSLFKIIFLSGLCTGGSTPMCPPCPQVTIPCSSVVTPCVPLTNCDDDDMIAGVKRQTNAQGEPCNSCQ